VIESTLNEAEPNNGPLLSHGRRMCHNYGSHIHSLVHFFTHTCLTSSSFNKDDKIVHAIKSIVHEIVMVLPARL